MRAPTRTRLLVVLLAVALLVGAVVVTRVVLERTGRTAFDDALAALPSDVRRVSFTDWTSVRGQVGPDLGDTPERGAVEDMVAAAYDADLSAASATDEAAGAMQAIFGFGPGTARWEVYGQADDGAALVLAPPEGTDFDVLADNLRSAGYPEPEGDSLVWPGGIDLVAGLDPTLTPVLQHVALLPDAGLVVASDTSAYAERAVAAADGDGDTARAVAGVDDLAARAEGLVSSVTWTGDFACADLAMSSADAADQAAAEARVAELGGVNPLAGLTLGLTSGGALRVVAHFEDADRAEADLEARAELAVGEAYGRGGSFADTYELTRARTVDADVVLDLEPLREGSFPLSGIYDGPVVFATC